MIDTELEKEESENKRIAGLYTIITNTIIFLILFFVKAWDFHTITPPIDAGIELNYGTDSKGTGNIQTYNKASDLKNSNESKASLEPTKTKEKVVAKVEKIKTQPLVAEKKVVKSKDAEAPVRTSEKESPVKVEPKKVEVKPSSKIEPKGTPTESTKPVIKPSIPTPEPQVQPKANPSGLFTKGNKTTGGNGTRDGKDPNPGGNNNGDGKGEVGDQGDPKGSVKAEGLYGKGGKGGGTGASISINGWTWRSKPNVNDDSDDTGKIVFQVKVDENGNILSVRTIESSVSPSVLDKYKRAVQSLDLKPSADGDAPSVSTGTITFILRAK